MSKIAGKQAAIYIDGDKVTGEIVPGLVSFTLPERTRIDVTTAGIDTEAFILGLNAGTVAVETIYDASNATLEAAITAGTAVGVHFYADVAGSSTLVFAAAYVVASVNTSGPNAAVRRTLTFVNAAA